MLCVFKSTRNIPKARRRLAQRPAGERHIVHYDFSACSDSGSVLGWVGCNYVPTCIRTIRFFYVLSHHNIPVQEQSCYFTAHIMHSKGRTSFKAVKTTASSLGIHTTSQSKNKLQIYELGEWWELRGTTSIRRLGRYLYPGTHTIDRSNTQAGSSIFCLQEVGSANADQYAYRKISTKSSDAITLVSCLSPPSCFGKKASQSLASL